MGYYGTAASLALHIIGEEGAERWQALTQRERGSGHAQCCPDGHYTPEAAASHGAEKAAAWLCQQARRLPASTYGGGILARSA